MPKTKTGCKPARIERTAGQTRPGQLKFQDGMCMNDDEGRSPDDWMDDVRSRVARIRHRRRVVVIASCGVALVVAAVVIAVAG
jgi:hypothetical protein